MKKGDICVIAGTNEILICMEEAGNGTFSERLENNEMGRYKIIGKLNDEQAKIYLEKHKEDVWKKR